MTKETIIFVLAMILWVMSLIAIDSINPCSNFAPNNIAGNCMQGIEE
jgi:hypothetical protein